MVPESSNIKAQYYQFLRSKNLVKTQFKKERREFKKQKAKTYLMKAGDFLDARAYRKSILAAYVSVISTAQVLLEDKGVLAKNCEALKIALKKLWSEKRDLGLIFDDVENYKIAVEKPRNQTSQNAQVCFQKAMCFYNTAPMK